MDVIVAGSGMIGIELQDSFERRHNLDGMALRLSLRRPIVPRLHIHHRFGIQGAGIGILGVVCPHFFHRVGIGGIEHLAFRIRVDGIANGERLDIRLFLRAHAGSQRVCPLNRFIGSLLGLAIHGQIDIGPERQCDSPVGHGRLRIEPRRLFERIDRFLMIERKDQSQPLVEILLRFGHGRGDGMVQVPQVIE